MIDLSFLLKLSVSVLVVIGLSLVTEYVNPKVAGILAGYPLGAAISLFFIGLEIGPERYGLNGLPAGRHVLWNCYFVRDCNCLSLNLSGSRW